MVRFAAIRSGGIYEKPSLNMTKNMLQEINEVDLIVHIGDFSYMYAGTLCSCVGVVD